MYQDILNFIGLFYSYTNANTIHTRLYEDPFVLISRNRKWIKKHLWRVRCLNLGYVMSFDCLGSEVRNCKSCRQRWSNTLKIRSQWLRLGNYQNANAQRQGRLQFTVNSPYWQCAALSPQINPNRPSMSTSLRQDCTSPRGFENFENITINSR